MSYLLLSFFFFFPKPDLQVGPFGSEITSTEVIYGKWVQEQLLMAHCYKLGQFPEKGNHCVPGGCPEILLLRSVK